jgi:uncharacterized protein YkwD
VPSRFSYYRYKNILLSILLIFALSLAGLGVSALTNSLIPFWLLLGFSVVYSIEKWLFPYTRKYKTVGKIYRLLLNLSLISLLGLIIWSGIELFSQRFMQSSLIGSFIFLGELAIFIWLCRVVVRNSWRQPSMKLTALTVICLFLIFSFAGVQPMAGYKDTFIETVTNFINEQKIKSAERAAQERIAEEERLSKLGISNPSEFIEEVDENKELRIGIEVVELVNVIRQERGSPELLWDETLYGYSKAHSEAMASRKDLFHSSMDKPYAENAWGGEGSKSWGAETIVESWMNSEMHRTWLLCPNLRHVAVGIAYSSNGMYASWTFWRSETQQSDWWYQYTPDNPPDWWY